MKNETLVWKTIQELDFILSIYFNRKKFKIPKSRMGIFRDIGWNIKTNYWARAPIFNRLVKVGIFIPANISRPQLYHLDFKKMNDVMWNDPIISKISETEWIVEKIFK